MGAGEAVDLIEAGAEDTKIPPRFILLINAAEDRLITRRAISLDINDKRWSSVAHR